MHELTILDIFFYILLILCISLFTFYIVFPPKPKEIIKEVIVQDTELLNSYIKLQEQYRELQFSYNEFERYLEGFERGAYTGYLKAKGIEE